MAGLQSITGGLGSYQAFRMMPYRTLRFPGSSDAQAMPAAMDQRYGYRQSNVMIPQFNTHSAVLGLRPFIDRGNPILTYVMHQAKQRRRPLQIQTEYLRLDRLRQTALTALRPRLLSRPVSHIRS